ncbi:hypothetical protein EUGRSUZ_C00364 [Eucalyptus grandis]|uniref:Uncharacterized protein n=2 Tax=Eucalyptus grandis TaxID=71139 RepID=A0A059CL48_EUCGR|nr:hypothetical protein EUGRSUZ_C00364 [Eucalyptus grandis]
MNRLLPCWCDLKISTLICVCCKIASLPPVAPRQHVFQMPPISQFLSSNTTSGSCIQLHMGHHEALSMRPATSSSSSIRDARCF